MTILYVVTAGEYSSYGIRAIFDSEEKAKEYVAELGTGDIELYGLNKEASGQRYSIEMDLNGNVVSCKAVSLKDGDTIHGYIHRPLGFKKLRQPWEREHPCFICSVLAKDEKHAIKIANEMRIEAIAYEKRG